MQKKIFKMDKMMGFLIFVIIVLLVLSGISMKNTVLALTGNYSKNVGDPLSAIDWNKLDDDFVAKSGDTMQGDLNLNGKKIMNLADPADNGDAVNKSTMDSAIAAISAGSANIKNTSGENLKVVCGSTPIGSTVWQNGGASTITTLVDASAAAFLDNNVIYFASLFGDLGMFSAIGQNSIYKPSSGNYRDGFRVYIINNDLSMYNAANATTPWNWHIRWCGIGK